MRKSSPVTMALDDVASTYLYPLKLGMRRNQHPGGSKCEKSFFTLHTSALWKSEGTTLCRNMLGVQSTDQNNHWNAIESLLQIFRQMCKGFWADLGKNKPTRCILGGLSLATANARDYGASMACSRKSWCSNRTDALARTASKWLLLHGTLIFSIPVPLFASTILKCPYSCGKLRQPHKMPMLPHAHPLRPAWSFDLFEAPVKRISIRSLQVKLWVEILINQ